MCSVKELEKRKLIFQYLDMNTLYEGFFSRKNNFKGIACIRDKCKGASNKITFMFLASEEFYPCRRTSFEPREPTRINLQSNQFVNPGKSNVCSFLIKLQENL